jgi:signal transduction histidine kinase
VTQVASVAQYLTSAGFVVLAAAIAYRWYRQRGRAQGMLALAIVCLGAVAALGRVGSVIGQSAVLEVLTITAFSLSGYFVLLFRNEFIPLGAAAFRRATGLAVGGLAVGVLAVTVFASADRALVTALTFAFIAAWAVLVGEPIVRFWLASNSLPAVQRARMRYLSIGFAILIAILFADVLGGTAFQSPTAIVVTQLIALAVVPAIYVSFAPPSLLRRVWRLGEENELRAAMQELLIFSPSREVLAQRAIQWAIRLMGANAGFVIDSDGAVLATSGIEPAAAADLVAKSGRTAEAEGGRIVTAPLHLSAGKGVLGVVAGPYTPLFGTDEVTQLSAYANSVAAGLESAQVAERMAAIESNKSQFLNLASHELRGPITVMRGYVSMLESGLFGRLNDSGVKAAAVMAAKVSEMNELIEEMIEVARLEDGALTLRPVESDLREVVRNAAESVAPMVDASHEVTLDLPDRRVRVKLDPDRTQTIVANLLSNAIKYSPAGGTVACQVRASAGVARVSVSDEGVGIATESLGTLFTRFGRVVTPETEHLKGTGLGLFLARQLARLQGGDITLVSTLGKGSTFTLHMPAAGGAAGGGEGPAGERSAAVERKPRESTGDVRARASRM